MAIEEAIRTTQFIRNKAIHFWMDAPRKSKINKIALNNYSDSNGHHEPNPRFLRKAEKSVKHAQCQIYKKEKSKKQRRKARVRYAWKHLRVSRERNEHSKRLGRCVCKANALVAYEDLNVKGLVKNHCLAKSINHVGWSLFRQWIEYFSTKFGTVLVAVPPQYIKDFQLKK